MAWTTPATWTPGQIMSAADFNTHLRDNLNYLLSGEVLNKAIYVGAANVTTTSTTFVDTDATNHKITLTPQSTRVMVAFTFGWQSSGTNQGEVDIILNSTTRYGDATHGMQATPATGNYITTLLAYFTGLTPGALQTFKLQYRATGAATTIAIFNNAVPVSMAAWEM